MPLATQLAGFVLLMIGIGSFLATGSEEFTALIPAVFGAVLLGAGVLAEKDPAKRRHAMHGALLVALLGLLATAPTAFGLGAMDDASDMAVIESWLTVVVCLVYLAAGVRSFVHARRARS